MTALAHRESYAVIGVADDYASLHAALRARAEEISTPRLMIDEVAGFHTGYASKLLAPTPIKHLGPVSMGPLLQTLGLKLIVVADDEGLARIRHRLPARLLSNVRTRAAHDEPEGN